MLASLFSIELVRFLFGFSAFPSSSSPPTPSSCSPSSCSPSSSSPSSSFPPLHPLPLPPLLLHLSVLRYDFEILASHSVLLDFQADDTSLHIHDILQRSIHAGHKHWLLQETVWTHDGKGSSPDVLCRTCIQSKREQYYATSLGSKISSY